MVLTLHLPIEVVSVGLLVLLLGVFPVALSFSLTHNVVIFYRPTTTARYLHVSLQAVATPSASATPGSEKSHAAAAKGKARGSSSSSSASTSARVRGLAFASSSSSSSSTVILSDWLDELNEEYSQTFASEDDILHEEEDEVFNRGRETANNGKLAGGAAIGFDTKTDADASSTNVLLDEITYAGGIGLSYSGRSGGSDVTGSELSAAHAVTTAPLSTTTTTPPEVEGGGTDSYDGTSEGSSRAPKAGGRSSGEGKKGIKANQNSSSSSSSSSSGSIAAAAIPLHFQKLIAALWRDLHEGSHLAYMGVMEQDKVKRALVLVTAFVALKQLPSFHHEGRSGSDNGSGGGGSARRLRSPQAMFEQMDENGDGEVSFAEFCRWYAAKVAVTEEEDDAATPASGDDGRTADDVNGGRLMRDNTVDRADLVGDRGSVFLEARGSGKPASSVGTIDLKGAVDVSESEKDVQPKTSLWPLMLTRPDAVKGGPLDVNSGKHWNGARGGGKALTEAEKDALREAWLAGPVPPRKKNLEDAAERAGGRGRGRHGSGRGRGTESEVGGGVKQTAPSVQAFLNNSAASAALSRAIEIVRILVTAMADSDTIIAALASDVMVTPHGSYDLELIDEQFGTIVKDIVEDRVLLERLLRVPSFQSQALLRQSRNVRAVNDLDDHHARLLREYLVATSKDVRAVVIHMADLLLRMRISQAPAARVPVADRHILALEALQLYVPVSNALGLGASFRELEELGYRTLFPESFGKLSAWHDKVAVAGQAMMGQAKKNILAALEAHPPLAAVVEAYSIKGRTKGVVSTFRKVFRQIKKVEDVHDMWGLRIIVIPRPDYATLLQRAAGRGSAEGGGGSDGGSRSDEGLLGPLASEFHTKREHGDLCDYTTTGRGGGGGGGNVQEEAVGEMKSKATDTIEAKEQVNGGAGGGGVVGLPAVFTAKRYPPPYRDHDSVLLHEVHEVVTAMFPRVEGRYKNYVDFPKPNGYRSLHDCLTHPSGLKFELQIRTLEMHEEAEGGGAAHSLYKGDLHGSPDAAKAFRAFQKKMGPGDTETAPGVAEGAADDRGGGGEEEEGGGGRKEHEREAERV